MNHERDEAIREMLTPDAICDLLRAHGPTTASDLCEVLGVSQQQISGNPLAIAGKIRRARLDGYPIVQRPVEGQRSRFEYALTERADAAASAGPIYDHGGWA